MRARSLRQQPARYVATQSSRAAEPLSLEELPDQGGYDVGSFQVEVITGTVEVRYQEIDGIESVLSPIGLTLNEQHLLCEAVRRVGLFRISGPEILLTKRNRSE